MCISSVHADMLRVGVIDTGLDLHDSRLSAHLCDTGHKDFTGKGLQDDEDHGTHIVGLIEQYAKDSNYCLVILKYYETIPESSGAAWELAAVKEAVKQHLDLVNMSLSGDGYIPEEKRLLCMSPETVFIIAAGNDGVDLDESPRCPASYGCANMLVVGSYHSAFSNYGKVVTAWENGEDVLSTLPNGETGHKTGTSQATAIRTGKLIYAIQHR